MSFDPLDDPEQHDELIVAVLADHGPLNQWALLSHLKDRQRSWPARRGTPSMGTRTAALAAWVLSAERRGLVRWDDGDLGLADASPN